MQVVYRDSAELDVHKKTVVACAITPQSSGAWHKKICTLTTMAKHLLNLSDWFTVWSVASEFYFANRTKRFARLNSPS
jgi:hypothetical protein